MFINQYAHACKETYVTYITVRTIHIVCPECYDELYRKDMDPGGGPNLLPATKKEELNAR